MAGAGLRRAARGSYTAAGYAFDGTLERRGELYIERVQAGSAQDLLRDNNRAGYAGEALDGDGLPFSFLMEEENRNVQRTHQAAKKKKKLTAAQWLSRAWRRESGAVVICCALMALNLVLLAFYGQGMIDGVRRQKDIAKYENGSAMYQQQIGEAERKIIKAQDGERVRNVAQNELGMLRKERVATQTIYIQTMNLSAQQPAAEAAQEEHGLLDWLLSVADIFDLKS